ncbi:MAG: hypothetical protein A2Y38_07500 [Spirochaetes bacterium GWB1_59_5]|nr:MAG: hypothetical protein A2Y38_07500 [Spirochaetes bacterium GWB1_59_5]
MDIFKGKSTNDDNSSEVAFDMFSDEMAFVDQIRSGARTAWATRQDASPDIAQAHPGQGRFATKGGWGLSTNGAKLYDSLMSALTVGFRDGRFGVHGEGNHFVHGEMTIDEFTHILGPLTVEQATQLMDTLLVAKKAIFQDEVEVRGLATFKANEIHEGKADYSKGKIKIPAENLIISEQDAVNFIQKLVISTIMGQMISAAGQVQLFKTGERPNGSI